MFIDTLLFDFSTHHVIKVEFIQFGGQVVLLWVLVVVLTSLVGSCYQWAHAQLVTHIAIETAC